MKCPKCGYLGFDRVDRCRNCGYDFSLAREITVPELSLRSEPQTDGFADLSLIAPREQDPLSHFDTELNRTARPSRTPAPIEAPPDAAAAVAGTAAAGEGETAVPSRREAVAPTPAREVLPLFGAPIPDDVPLITRPSPPRPPLAVRRATPEVPRVRPELPRTPSVDLRLDLQAPDHSEPSVDESAPLRSLPWSEPDLVDDAPLGARLLAVAIDLGILAAIDAIVVYFTMQICGLSLADVGALPKVPLLAFLAVQNGGYLIAFTAGGQTLGKMATGIRVVTAGSGSPLDVGRAAARTLMWVVLAVPAGLGFLSAVFSADRRGFHDRFAGSRVVRASA